MQQPRRCRVRYLRQRDREERRARNKNKRSRTSADPTGWGKQTNERRNSILAAKHATGWKKGMKIATKTIHTGASKRARHTRTHTRTHAPFTDGATVVAKEDEYTVNSSSQVGSGSPPAHCYLRPRGYDSSSLVRGPTSNGWLRFGSDKYARTAFATQKRALLVW